MAKIIDDNQATMHVYDEFEKWKKELDPDYGAKDAEVLRRPTSEYDCATQEESIKGVCKRCGALSTGAVFCTECGIGRVALYDPENYKPVDTVTYERGVCSRCNSKNVLVKYLPHKDEYTCMDCAHKNPTCTAHVDECCNCGILTMEGHRYNAGYGIVCRDCYENGHYGPFPVATATEVMPRRTWGDMTLRELLAKCRSYDSNKCPDECDIPTELCHKGLTSIEYGRSLNKEVPE